MVGTVTFLQELSRSKYAKLLVVLDFCLRENKSQL